MKIPSLGSLRAFVIHKHWASSLHYDLRLEILGVLCSWVVPKGPSTDARKRRLAKRMPDHPMTTLRREKVIEDGYGAGLIIVWDIGSYVNCTVEGGKIVPIEQALLNGYMRFELVGKRLRGCFELTRQADGEWILVKLPDAHADPVDDILLRYQNSALSGWPKDRFARPTASLFAYL